MKINFHLSSIIILSITMNIINKPPIYLNIFYPGWHLQQNAQEAMFSLILKRNRSLFKCLYGTFQVSFRYSIPKRIIDVSDINLLSPLVCVESSVRARITRTVSHACLRFFLVINTTALQIPWHA